MKPFDYNQLNEHQPCSGLKRLSRNIFIRDIKTIAKPVINESIPALWLAVRKLIKLIKG